MADRVLMDDTRAVIKRLRGMGLTVTRARRGAHLHVRNESGALVAVFPGSPSDWRWSRNLQSSLRRAGVLGRTETLL